MSRLVRTTVLVVGFWAACHVAPAAPRRAAAPKDEPPAINPFGPIKTEREDAIPGYLETSDGKVYFGNLYMTRDKRLKLEDASRQIAGKDPADDKSEKRQREIPLRVVQQIECKVEKEWMEKEWRFKELALDEKLYTGRTYPARLYTHTVTLRDGRKITGALAEIIYVQPVFESADTASRDPSRLQPERFLLHKRDKGEIGAELKSLCYVKLVKLGPEALEEGKRKAAKPGGKRE